MHINFYLKMLNNVFWNKEIYQPGAYPGFPVGGGANPPRGEGHQHMILPKFPKNCMKLRKFWALGEGDGAGGSPFRSATVSHGSGSGCVALD